MKKALLLILFVCTHFTGNLKAQGKDDCKYDPSNVTDDCYCYFDTIYNKCLYLRFHGEQPVLADGRTISDLVKSIKLPEDFLDENGNYISIIPITMLMIIDSDGTLIRCKVLKRVGEGNTDVESNEVTAFERIVLRVFRAEKHWLPAKCNGENIAVKYYIPMRMEIPFPGDRHNFYP